jgi:hypothetical protein
MPTINEQMLLKKISMQISGIEACHMQLLFASSNIHPPSTHKLTKIKKNLKPQQRSQNVIINKINNYFKSLYWQGPRVTRALLLFVKGWLDSLCSEF